MYYLTNGHVNRVAYSTERMAIMQGRNAVEGGSTDWFIIEDEDDFIVYQEYPAQEFI